MEKNFIGSVIYLNSQEIDNVIESLDGGLVQQIKVTEKIQKNRKGEGGIKIPLTDIGGKGEIGQFNETSTETTTSQTPISRFTRLRKQLLANEWLKYINATSLDEHKDFSVGDFVEIQGEIYLSKFSLFTDILSQHLSFYDKFGDLLGPKPTNDPQMTQKMQYFSGIGSNNIFTYIKTSKLASAKRGFDFACNMNPNKLLINRNELSGEAVLFGRIKKILMKNEIFYPYQLIPGQEQLSNMQIKQVIKTFTSQKNNFKFTEEDFKVRYPSIIITPFAIYN